VCFELYTKADPAAAPTATACFSWEVYAEVAVITTFDGRLSLGYRKHRP
jgi:hypothetical protein